MKSRSWCFTINNPTEEDRSDIHDLIAVAEYVIIGNEIGEQGTPHFQGYCEFQHARTLNGVKRILKRAHLERRRGTPQEAITYCEKEGDFIEHGIRPTTTKLTPKERWTRILHLAETGNVEALKEEFPGEYIRYHEKLKSMIVRQPTILTILENEWWYGSTGTGKSRRLWNIYPNHYQKELNKWWCGYQGQDVVAIEEWAPKNECTASALKIWADRYPFTAQVKGGSLQRIRPKKIIVLSNYTIEQCFPAMEDCEPIKRRFQVVHFPFPLEHFEGNNILDWVDL